MLYFIIFGYNFYVQIYKVKWYTHTCTSNSGVEGTHIGGKPAATHLNMK